MRQDLINQYRQKKKKRQQNIAEQQIIAFIQACIKATVDEAMKELFNGFQK